MKNYVKVDLDEAASTPQDAARRVKDALISQGDNTTQVFARTNDTVLVCVHESRDAEDEMADRFMEAGFGCFVGSTEEVATEEEPETVVTDLTTND